MAIATAQRFQSRIASVTAQARPTVRGMQVEASRVAGTVVQSLGKAMGQTKGNWKTTAMMAGGAVLSFFGGVGITAAFALERQKNAMIAKDGKKVLANYYRNQVATQLGINPKHVGVTELEMAARTNTTFAQAIAKLERERGDNNRQNNFVTGGAFALGGMMPGLSGFSHLAAHGAVAVGGSVAASAFNADVLHTHDVMEKLNEKRLHGQPITATDIVLLQISQNEELQKQLKKTNGVAFSKMTDEQQRGVMIAMPEIQQARVLAERANAMIATGEAKEQDILMMVSAEPIAQVAPPVQAAAPQGGWAARVGGPRAGANVSFRAQVEARRAANDVAQTTAQAI